MNRQKFWRGISPLSLAPGAPERIVKLCSAGAEMLALSADHSLYHCDQANDELSFRRVPGLLALDLASTDRTLYIVDAHGRLFKSSVTDIEAREELVVREEARCCPHGFRTSSFKVKFRTVVASEFGALFIASDGQLWGCGSMPQIALDSADVQKITFFEGRTVFGASLGAKFAAVVARRNVRRSGDGTTDSEEEEEVFASACAQCRAHAWPASPASDACPLGVQLSRSSEDTSSATAPPDALADAQSFTEDSSQSTDESRLKIATLQNQPCKSDETAEVDSKDEGSESESSQSNTDKANNIFMNADAARQFLSRQLSWVSAGEDYLAEYTEKPTRIIKENVSNLTNLVVESVRTVGDKVATLSRHVSGSSDPRDAADPPAPPPAAPAASLLYSCASGYRLDDLQFSTSTVASEKDDRATDERADCLVRLGRNILGTELWTWGDIEHGQLGIGDTVKRLKPMLVTSLSGFGLQKVCCGSSHCVTFTLDGRMFGWGSNRYHQIGFESREDRSSPVQFTENSSADRVRDVVAADDRTLAYTHRGNIYYMGKYPDEFTEKVLNLNENIALNAENKNDNLENIIKDDIEGPQSSKKWQNKCYHWRLSSAGDLTHSFVEESSRCSALPDLSVAQRILEEMLLIYHYLSKPFLKRSKAITTHTSVYETVCELFADILNVTALNVLSMWQYTENHINECEISIIKNCEMYIYLYKKYLTALCNLISISGFSQIANIVDVPSSIYNLFSDQLPTNKQKNNKKTAEAIVALAFARPLTRLSSYKCIVKSLLRCNAKNTNDFDTDKRLTEVLALWDSLIEEQEKKKRDAEITKLFWETSGKVIDVYKTPERRLIRESRSRPLSLVNAGRFSSHWFVLLSDVFLHISGSSQLVHPLETIWVEALPDSDVTQNYIQLVTPEETMSVSTSTSQEKNEWLQALQNSIKSALKKESSIKPPAVRTASYTFTNKNQLYKDAKYHGRWLDGKIHGNGRVDWPDGKMYVGQFQMNSFNGHGRMEIPGVGVYEGQWKDNLQNGYGVMKYASGDLYEGYFKEGLPHGHGVRRQGDFTSSSATIYLGEWSRGARHGYGVMDDIGKGEKYLGSWSENRKHGCGLIVTLDGIYYEGVFMQDVLTGHGVMVFEDGTHYEGEFRSAGVFSGKGVLTFSSGDRIEGSLGGAWTEGVKVSNATLHMNVSSPAPPANSKPNSFGKLCVAPHQKWNALFRQCYQSLSIPDTALTPTGSHFSNGSPSGNPVDNKKIWQNVALLISNSHKDINKKRGTLSKGDDDLEKSVDCLEVIPEFGQKNLDLDSYMKLRHYLQKACETPHHPVGQLALGVTNAFNTTYGGVRVHPLLLSHAVRELSSVTARLYRLVRLLFPALPPPGADLVLPRGGGEENPLDGEVVSAASLLQPALLPRVHPALFVLYALHNKREDDLYWRRLLKWNRQPDVTLMAFLGIDQKFWMAAALSPAASTPPQPEQQFLEAVETLQQLKTTFSPIEKLLVVRSTFQQLTAAVQSTLGESYLWSMDELFPVFHFVVVRARILQLGSEIHFVEDFLEPSMQHGELGIMFTTLKACYFQILQEKMTLNS